MYRRNSENISRIQIHGFVKCLKCSNPMSTVVVTIITSFNHLSSTFFISRSEMWMSFILVTDIKTVFAKILSSR
jgi:hypothetical protein